MEYGLWPPLPVCLWQWCCLNPCSNGIWSLTKLLSRSSPVTRTVLILVLMEYGLWLRESSSEFFLRPRLNPCSNGIWSLTVGLFEIRDDWSVLILVLMEYGLWLAMGVCTGVMASSLNPCSNGIWSLTGDRITGGSNAIGLNPCSNGIWSLTYILDNA